MPLATNRTAGQVITSADINGIASSVNSNATALLSANAATALGWKVATDAAYGADPTGVTDATAALQACLNAAAADGTTAYAAGTFKVLSPLTAKCGLDFRRATINYGGSGTAFTVGDATVLSWKTFLLPAIVGTVKTVNGWAQVAGTVGVKIINANTCSIAIPHVANFETGVVMYGQGSGTTYCTVMVGHLDNNKRNLVLDADSTGWSNQNLYLGGRYGHNSAEGASVAGARHVLCTAGLASPINNNLWLNGSFEGDTPEFQVDVAGSYNSFTSCRWEVTGGGRVRWQADAIDNSIRDGYKSDVIVETTITGALRNKIQAGNRFDITGTSATSVLRVQNTSSDAVYGLAVFGAASRADTDYRWRWSANQLEAKRVAETGARVILDGNNGRMYLGTGAAAPLMYLSATGTTGLTFNGGSLYSGTDNTYDIGLISSLRYRYIRAGTALVTGAVATGSRPAAATAGAGAMVFDTTLNKPVWSDGTVWRDATGTAV